MEREAEKMTYEERKQRVEAELAAVGYKPCGENRYSRVEANGKVYQVCIDERGQLWTF